MAADLLAKAESATAALGQQMAELMAQQEAASAARVVNTPTRADTSDSNDLRQLLEAEMAVQQEVLRRAESAEAEAELLRKQLEVLKEDLSEVSMDNDPMQTYNIKVLEELATAQSTAAMAQAELTELRKQNKSFQKELAQLRKNGGGVGVVASNGKANGKEVCVCGGVVGVLRGGCVLRGIQTLQYCGLQTMPQHKHMFMQTYSQFFMHSMITVHNVQYNHCSSCTPHTCTHNPNRMHVWQQHSPVWRSCRGKMSRCRKQLPNGT